jgi:hypothetical protein
LLCTSSLKFKKVVQGLYPFLVQVLSTPVPYLVQANTTGIGINFIHKVFTTFLRTLIGSSIYKSRNGLCEVNRFIAVHFLDKEMCDVFAISGVACIPLANTYLTPNRKAVVT